MYRKTRSEKLPEALIIGPMRSATTWVHRYLENRDDVCTPMDVKETFFFDRRFEKGLDWYARHFQNCRETRIAVEVGPSYFHSNEAPRRIRGTLGDIPLVVIYRDPVERSFSHFAHLRRYGFTSLPLREASEEYPEILSASRYAEQLKRWADHFGSDHLNILCLDTLRSSPDQFAANLTEALGITFAPVPGDLKKPVHRSTVPKSNMLAGMAWRMADILRGWRLHKVVELAKRIGVKDAVIEEAQGARSQPTESERRWLQSQLGGSIQEARKAVSKLTK